MVGIPREFSSSTSGWNSAAPVRNPGTRIAALRFGRFANSFVTLVVRDCDDRASDCEQSASSSRWRRNCFWNIMMNMCSVPFLNNNNCCIAGKVCMVPPTGMKLFCMICHLPSWSLSSCFVSVSW